MSFILDALKKSESERQRQSLPGLVDTSIVRPRARWPTWALALGVLLAVNLVGLGIMVTRTMMTPETPKAGAAPKPEVKTAASEPAHFSPLDTLADAPAESAPTQYAPEIPVPAPVQTKPVNPQPLDTRPVRRRDPTLTDEDYKTGDAEVLPTMSELNLSGAQSLPELHLDVHVFSTHPADRFVYVNMRKYHEGGTLQEGPAIERIRRDGVVLSYQGLRFLLPRQ